MRRSPCPCTVTWAHVVVNVVGGLRDQHDLAVVQPMIRSQQPAAQTLGDLCDVSLGRNRVAQEADADPEFRVVRAADVGTDLTPWRDLPPSTPRKRSSVEVAPGDIVGSISGPHGRWVVVPDGYGPAFASDHTVVLRKRRNVSMWYLCGFLRSTHGKTFISATVHGTVISRISPDALKQILIPPCPLDTSYVDHVFRNFHGELRRIEFEIEGLRNRPNQVYEGDVRGKTIARLDALQGITASIHAMTNLSDPFWIAQNSFPYPIARTLRAIQRTSSPRERYHEIVHEGLETVSAILTAICAAVARKRHLANGRRVKNWVNAVRRGGATIGTRHAMVLQVAAGLISAGHAEDIGGLGRALGSTDAPAVVLMDKLLKERNRIHGDHPKTDVQFQQRLTESEGDLRQLLESLSFLARWEVMYAESVEPLESEDGSTRYSATFRVLRGDNPDWEFVIHDSEFPIYPRRVYALVDGQQLIELYPYLLVQHCPLCGAMEVYYPNSFEGSNVHLNSIDRGHPQNDSGDRLLRDLRRELAALV